MGRAGCDLLCRSSQRGHHKTCCEQENRFILTESSSYLELKGCLMWLQQCLSTFSPVLVSSLKQLLAFKLQKSLKIHKHILRKCSHFCNCRIIIYFYSDFKLETQQKAIIWLMICGKTLWSKQEFRGGENIHNLTLETCTFCRWCMVFKRFANRKLRYLTCI